MSSVDDLRPPTGDDWCALSDAPLAVGDAITWATLPGCGAVVAFTGTSRDHSPGRTGVTVLEYEAYTEQVEPVLASVSAALRARWAEVGRVVLWHRVGEVPVGEASVVVVVSAPHRTEAFDAARFGIDTVKASAPIWKREVHDGGADWGSDAVSVQPVGGVVAATSASSQRLDGAGGRGAPR